MQPYFWSQLCYIYRFFFVVKRPGGTFLHMITYCASNQ